MKILQICQFFTPERGGSAVIPYQISKYLASKGHEVTVITTDYHMEYAKFEPIENVKIFALPCVNIAGMLVSTKMISEIRSQMRNFDLVHMHHFRTYPNLIAYHYAKKFGVPYIIQAHGSVLPALNQVFSKRLYDSFYGNNMLANSKKLVALTELEKDQYLQLGISNDKIVKIPNGLDLKEFEICVESNFFEEKYGISRDIKIILFLGRIHEVKGINYLIDAFSLLSEDMKNAILVIAGPDDGFLSRMQEYIKKVGISEKILISGPLYGNEKLKAYRSADIVICPSIYEIFGLVPIEALMAGTPVIVTKQCGCAEYLQLFKYPYIVNYGDISGMKELINKVLNDVEIGIKIQNAQKGIENTFSWYVIGDQFGNLYQDCL